MIAYLKCRMACLMSKNLSFMQEHSYQHQGWFAVSDVCVSETIKARKIEIKANPCEVISSFFTLT